MPEKTPQDQAITFIAAYEHADAGVYEKHVVRLARRWLRTMNSRHTTQGVVNKLLEEMLR